MAEFTLSDRWSDSPRYWFLGYHLMMTTKIFFYSDTLQFMKLEYLCTARGLRVNSKAPPACCSEVFVLTCDLLTACSTRPSPGPVYIYIGEVVD
jgi:hypothetical protein